MDVAKWTSPVQKQNLRRQRKSWQSRREQPVAAQPQQPPPSQGNTAAQTRGPLQRRSPQGRGAAGPGGSENRRARTNPSLREPSPLREGEGSESRATRASSRRQRQGRSAAGGQPAAGSRAGAPTEVVSLSPRSCPSTHDPRPASNGRAKESREGQSPNQGMDRRAHRGGRRAKRRRLIRVRAIARI